MKIALVGDYDAGVIAHQAIPQALDLASRLLALEVEPVWLHSSEAGSVDLDAYDALWCVPASPYQDQAAVLEAIRHARENDMPFLGTCGGYQHALIEFARNVLDCRQAQSSEEDPSTEMSLIDALSCRLSDAAAPVNLHRESRVAQIYQSHRISEEYNCGFGMNPAYRDLFVGSGLIFSGHDDAGSPRIFEVPALRFYLGTGFQPERSALIGMTHPLIIAFLTAGM